MLQPVLGRILTVFVEKFGDLKLPDSIFVNTVNTVGHHLLLKITLSVADEN